tara:strand:- start:392 stop:985 length:594 start_codon:yes stop_codon:yes gene_type:complete
MLIQFLILALIMVFLYNLFDNYFNKNKENFFNENSSSGSSNQNSNFLTDDTDTDSDSETLNDIQNSSNNNQMSNFINTTTDSTLPMDTTTNSNQLGPPPLITPSYQVEGSLNANERAEVLSQQQAGNILILNNLVNQSLGGSYNEVINQKNAIQNQNTVNTTNIGLLKSNMDTSNAVNTFSPYASSNNSGPIPFINN